MRHGPGHGHAIGHLATAPSSRQSRRNRPISMLPARYPCPMLTMPEIRLIPVNSAGGHHSCIRDPPLSEGGGPANDASGLPRRDLSTPGSLRSPALSPSLASGFSVLGRAFSDAWTRYSPHIRRSGASLAPHGALMSASFSAKYALENNSSKSTLPICICTSGEG